ncbi:ANK_REP_REGION domain-containing protein, partial [Nephila pilipes]
NPNIVSDLTEQFKTPLHIAAENGHLDIARLLLEYDADILAKDSSGLTAMDLAEKSDHPHVMELLKATANLNSVVAIVRR